MFTLLPRHALTRLYNAARDSDGRELLRIAYFYVQTLDEAYELVECLLETTGERRVAEQAVQAAPPACHSAHQRALRGRI